MTNRLNMTRREYEQYVTVAMLLGRTYDWRVHTMWNTGDADIDADTLEELADDSVYSTMRKLQGSLTYDLSWEGLQRYQSDIERGYRCVAIPDPR